MSFVGRGSIEIKESREESNLRGGRKEGRKEITHNFLMTGNMLYIYLP